MLGDDVYNNPLYAYDVPLYDKEFYKWFRYLEGEISLDNGYCYMQYIFIDGIRSDDLFGVCVYYINEDTLLISHLASRNSHVVCLAKRV